MKTKFYQFIGAMLALMGLVQAAGAAVNPDDLLPAEEAFVPTVEVSEQGVKAKFKVADGYYLYQSQISVSTNLPKSPFAEPVFSAGTVKNDEFFGKQTVYHHQAEAKWAYKKPFNEVYRLTVHYRGCADAGVCYPPVESTFEIRGTGVYHTAAEKGADLFVKKPLGAASETEHSVNASALPAPADADSGLTLSRERLWANLLGFFVAGLGLSFTACMYPLLPIVSSIIVGDRGGRKGRALILSFVYVQGLALTYTAVGVLAGLTGALLTVWLQQAWVVLAAAGLLVVLALSMFGCFQIQLPAVVQSYFQNQSNRLSGGKVLSVFVMGMLSALIVGPCVAPPLAAALGYIGRTGDAVLGGAVLYAMALGTGVPLMVVGTFGGHVLPRAGDWMNGIKYAFGVILLAVAVYLAKPFLPYALTVALFTALLIVPAIYVFWRSKSVSGSLKRGAWVLAVLLGGMGLWFAGQSVRGETTALHHFLTLYAPNRHALPIQKFRDVAELKAQINAAFAADPNTPILLDFYADWCASCKEMEAKTFPNAEVQAALPMTRLFQADVTAHTPEQQALLKEYGLFGPPGLFVVRADGGHSQGLLGYVSPAELVAWYRAQQH